MNKPIKANWRLDIKDGMIQISVQRDRYTMENIREFSYQLKEFGEVYFEDNTAMVYDFHRITMAVSQFFDPYDVYSYISYLSESALGSRYPRE